MIIVLFITSSGVFLNAKSRSERYSFNLECWHLARETNKVTEVSVTSDRIQVSSGLSGRNSVASGLRAEEVSWAGGPQGSWQHRGSQRGQDVQNKCERQQFMLRVVGVSQKVRRSYILFCQFKHWTASSKVIFFSYICRSQEQERGEEGLSYSTAFALATQWHPRSLWPRIVHVHGKHFFQ